MMQGISKACLSSALCLYWGALFCFLHLSSSAHAGLVSSQETQRADGLCASLVLPYRVYACQEFVAQTGDGFLLGVQRMWRPDIIQGKTAQPVLLFHGILTGGDVWVINPPGEGLGFMMADAGYDVWITNYRSTAFSYGHLSYKHADKGFWDWSMDDLASEDLPSALQLIHSKTGKKIYLVAYSEGAQSTLAAFSEGLCVDLVSKAVLMAPVSYLTSGPQLVYIASTLRLQRIYQALNIYQLSTRSPGGRELVDVLCATASVKCYRDWFRLFSGFICCINSTRRAYIDKYETQATSVKNLDHYSQLLRLGTFGKYDYGEAENMKRYKQKTPPDYDLSKFPSNQIPMLFISSGNDSLANTVDVAHLYRDIPPGFQRRLVENFGHLDFVFGDTANRVVYDYAMEFLA
ncbi:hypothetical protein L7F22_057300 [Adiantum nelumboides]|nr:hypothetical protein [Adiantum nelumboides]